MQFVMQKNACTWHNHVTVKLQLTLSFSAVNIETGKPFKYGPNLQIMSRFIVRLL